MRIREAVESGRVEEGVRRVNELDSEVCVSFLVLFLFSNFFFLVPFLSFPFLFLPFFLFLLSSLSFLSPTYLIPTQSAFSQFLPFFLSF